MTAKLTDDLIVLDFGNERFFVRSSSYGVGSFCRTRQRQADLEYAYSADSVMHNATYHTMKALLI